MIGAAEPLYSTALPDNLGTLERRKHTSGERRSAAVEGTGLMGMGSVERSDGGEADRTVRLGRGGDRRRSGCRVPHDLAGRAQDAAFGSR